MNIFRFKECLKCGGDLTPDEEDWKCFQCGRIYYHIEPITDNIVNIRLSHGGRPRIRNKLILVL